MKELHFVLFLTHFQFLLRTLRNWAHHSCCSFKEKCLKYFLEFRLGALTKNHLVSCDRRTDCQIALWNWIWTLNPYHPIIQMSVCLLLSIMVLRQTIFFCLFVLMMKIFSLHLAELPNGFLKHKSKTNTGSEEAFLEYF